MEGKVPSDPRTSKDAVTVGVKGQGVVVSDGEVAGLDELGVVPTLPAMVSLSELHEEEGDSGGSSGSDEGERLCVAATHTITS